MMVCSSQNQRPVTHVKITLRFPVLRPLSCVCPQRQTLTGHDAAQARTNCLHSSRHAWNEDPYKEYTTEAHQYLKQVIIICAK